MIAETINQKIAEALKARDEIRLSTLRMLSSALNYEKIAKQHSLSEEEELVVVKKEEKELKILQKYLPNELSSEEVEKIVQEAIQEVGSSDLADFGRVMGAAMN